MSISRQNLTIIIVTFKSDHIIDECIRSIDKEVKIIVIDNSNDKNLKEKIEKNYQNVKCVLSTKNLGMGTGNNLGIKNIETDFALILNPDVTLEMDTINELISNAKKIDSFGIIAPISKNINYPNYKIDKKEKNTLNNIHPFKVNSVDGFSMLINLKRLNYLESFKNHQYFDENFFMYLENDDLCKRITDSNENIYIIPTSKINHLGGKAVNEIYKDEIEFSRNWHWMWSKFYFNKKHYGFFSALLNSIPNFFSAIFKFCLYLMINNKKRKEIYKNRILGFTNALIGNKSYYRPDINN